VQTAPDSNQEYPLRGGTTLIISTHGTGGVSSRGEPFVHYAVYKPLHGRDGRHRLQRQAAFLEQQGIKPGIAADGLRINFALVHGGA
jgi:hypothetical protein